MDQIVEFMERLGFADLTMQKKQLDNMLTVLTKLGMVAPTDTQPQPEGPQPVVGQ
jgi:hypothetical protein